MASSLACARGVWRMRRGASVNVVQHAHVAEQVELLEHHAHFAALALQRGRRSSHTSTPSMVMRPLSCGSSRLIARSSVLLPEPEAPMITVTSPVWNTVDTPLSTWCVPKRLAHALGHDVGLGLSVGVHWLRPSTSKRYSTAFEICVTSVVSSR